MEHKPVLLGQVEEVLAPKEGEIFADLTAGYGGHAELLLSKVGKNGSAYLFDQDRDATAHLRRKFKSNPNVVVVQQNFADINFENLPKFNMILADLGVSSPQLDTAQRGFSFRADGPLDMRMNQAQKLTAAQIVNTSSEKELADIIYSFGEEYRSRIIAKAIVRARSHSSLQTTKQLADVIHSVVKKTSKLDPATKTFQALRIAVNGELDALRTVLTSSTSALAKDGRLAVISFHSLEDRIVKQFFRSICTPTLNEYGQIEKPAQFQYVTKKALKGNQFDTNPRARSAKLRAVVKQT